MRRNSFFLSFSFLLILSPSVLSQSTGDAALSAIRSSDRSAKFAKSKDAMPPDEHLRRAAIYLANRLFADARTHWQAILDNYPNDSAVPSALLGMARSFFVERRYDDAQRTYERLARAFPETKEGREGLNFAASALLRMGRGAEAAARYIEYIQRYPNGERIDTAHLNAIDGYGEAGQPQAAIEWIERTRQRFAGTVTERNAVFTRLRLDIALADWPHAVQTADDLLRSPLLSGSSTTADEVL